MFFLDEDHCITHIAGSLADWLQADPDRYIGEPISSVIRPEDVGSFEVALDRLEATRTTQTIACHIDAGGDQIPVDIELTRLGPDTSLGVTMGTISREALAAVDPDSTARIVQLRNFLELLDDPAVIYELIDTEPQIQSVNSTFESVFGHRAEHVVGESLSECIVPAEYLSEAERFYQQVANGNVTREIVTRRTTDGRQEFAYRGVPFDHEGGRVYGIAIYADMSDGQQTRQHLRVLHRVLRHNLRNELTVILGQAEKIASDASTPEIRQAAGQILDRAGNLEQVSEKAHVAENILGEPPSDTIIEVGGLTSSVVSEARDRWPSATIDTDIESGMPVATGFELKDALENLVENAIVHNTDAPTVSVTTRTETPIHASTRGSGRNALIKVTDDGPGIPDHERAVIFDDEDITQLKHGSGLGLWVVRWIIESANGSLTYNRSDGRTTITVRLPIADGAQETPHWESVNQDWF